MSTKKKLLLAGGGGGHYFFSSADGLPPNVNSGGGNASIDDNNNFYVTEFSSGTPIIEAYTGNNPTGLWRTAFGTASYDRAYGTCVDSTNGYVYLIGALGSTGSGDFYVAQLDVADGSVNWQRTAGTALSDQDFGFNGCIDDSGNVYVVGRAYVDYVSYVRNLGVVKYNSSGTYQASNTFGDSADDQGDYNFSIDFDGTNINLLDAGSGAARGFNLTITPTSLASITNSYEYTCSTGYQEFPLGIHCVSGGNKYLLGTHWESFGGQYRAAIVKLNSSDVIQWTRHIYSASADSSFMDAVEDGSGNVFACGEENGKPMVAKFNSSGSLQWSNYVSSKTGAWSAIKLADNGDLLLTGDLVTARLPSDGSKTGTYGSFTYASYTATNSVTTYARATSGWSATSSLSSATAVKAYSTTTPSISAERF